MKAFAEALIKELADHYQCYGFGYNVSVSLEHSPINIIGGFSPVAMQAGNSRYEMRFKFKQDLGNHKLPIGVLESLTNINTHLGEILSRYIINTRCQLSRYHGINELDCEVDFILSGEESTEELVNRIKMASWAKFSAEFDAEIDKTFKSKWVRV